MCGMQWGCRDMQWGCRGMQWHSSGDVVICACRMIGACYEAATMRSCTMPSARSCMHAHATAVHQVVNGANLHAR